MVVGRFPALASSLLMLAGALSLAPAAEAHHGATCRSGQGFEFEEDFDQERAGGTSYDFNGFDHWTVSGGSVDLYYEGDEGDVPSDTEFPWDDGLGYYVDLDGGTPGLLQTKAVHSFPEGTRLQFELELRGNAASEAADVVSIFLRPTGGTPILVGKTAAPNVERSHHFRVADYDVASDFTGTIALRNSGSDDRGAFLTEFRVCSLLPRPDSWWQSSDCLGNPIFEDNFFQDGVGDPHGPQALESLDHGVAPGTSFAHWTVTSGSVDLLSSSSTSGHHVDLDGRLGPAGTLTTRDEWTFPAGRSFVVELVVWGHGPPDKTLDQVEVRLDTASASILLATLDVSPSTDSRRSLVAWTPSEETAGRLSISGLGDDEDGARLDHVWLCEAEPPTASPPPPAECAGPVAVEPFDDLSAWAFDHRGEGRAVLGVEGEQGGTWDAGHGSYLRLGQDLLATYRLPDLAPHETVLVQFELAGSHLFAPHGFFNVHLEHRYDSVETYADLLGPEGADLGGATGMRVFASRVDDGFRRVEIAWRAGALPMQDAVLVFERYPESFYPLTVPPPPEEGPVLDNLRVCGTLYDDALPTPGALSFCVPAKGSGVGAADRDGDGIPAVYAKGGSQTVTVDGSGSPSLEPRPASCAVAGDADDSGRGPAWLASLKAFANEVVRLVK